MSTVGSSSLQIEQINITGKEVTKPGLKQKKKRDLKTNILINKSLFSNLKTKSFS